MNYLDAEHRKIQNRIDLSGKSIVDSDIFVVLGDVKAPRVNNPAGYLLIHLLRKIQRAAGCVRKASMPNMILVQDLAHIPKTAGSVVKLNHATLSKRSTITVDVLKKKFDGVEILDPFVEVENGLMNLYGPKQDIMDFKQNNHEEKHSLFDSSVDPIANSEAVNFSSFQAAVHCLICSKHCIKCLKHVLNSMTSVEIVEKFVQSICRRVFLPRNKNKVTQFEWINDFGSKYTYSSWRMAAPDVKNLSPSFSSRMIISEEHRFPNVKLKIIVNEPIAAEPQPSHHVAQEVHSKQLLMPEKNHPCSILKERQVFCRNPSEMNQSPLPSPPSSSSSLVSSYTLPELEQQETIQVVNKMKDPRMAKRTGVPFVSPKSPESKPPTPSTASTSSSSTVSVFNFPLNLQQSPHLPPMTAKAQEAMPLAYATARECLKHWKLPIHRKHPEQVFCIYCCVFVDDMGPSCGFHDAGETRLKEELEHFNLVPSKNVSVIEMEHHDAILKYIKEKYRAWKKNNFMQQVQMPVLPSLTPVDVPTTDPDETKKVTRKIKDPRMAKRTGVPFFRPKSPEKPAETPFPETKRKIERKRTYISSSSESDDESDVEHKQNRWKKSLSIRMKC